MTNYIVIERNEYKKKLLFSSKRGKNSKHLNNVNKWSNEWELLIFIIKKMLKTCCFISFECHIVRILFVPKFTLRLIYELKFLLGIFYRQRSQLGYNFTLDGHSYLACLHNDIYCTVDILY